MKWTDFLRPLLVRSLLWHLPVFPLILFLVVHVGLNACIFANDGGVMFNKAAHFMGSNVVPRILEIALFATILLHIVQGFVLEAKNRSTRKTGYAVELGNKGSKWYSRSMGLLGTLLLLFLVMHISHFWVPSRITGLEPTLIDGKEYHNLFGEMVTVFQSPMVVLLYVLGCISLGYHLAHGFQSAFRTLGVGNSRYMVLIKTVGYGFAVLVPLVFAAMPILMYFGVIK